MIAAVGEVEGAVEGAEPGSPLEPHPAIRTVATVNAARRLMARRTSHWRLGDRAGRLLVSHTVGRHGRGDSIPGVETGDQVVACTAAS